MRYVIIRDDDTNALTPISYLDRLYRPFLNRGLPVNLAVIPNVSTSATWSEGNPELFLMAKPGGQIPSALPIGSNARLVDYLKANPLYNLVQHGCRHEFVHNVPEFSHGDQTEIEARLEEGLHFFEKAGFPRPTTFVAPYDQISATSLRQIKKRFRVLSTGWYQLNRLPVTWWPSYAIKKTFKQPHWRVGKTFLLSHPGCFLSYHRNYQSMLDEIIQSIEQRQLTVLVTHWWEYFRENKPDDRFISVLHQLADYLGIAKDVRVVTFDDVAAEKVHLS